MEHLKIFINLTRLNKPIGYMLLFWPCSWGLAYAYNLDQDLEIFIYYLILFFLGSILMRSAGCIFNDIIDKDLDKKVARTKLRPIAAGKISIKKSFFYVISLCALAFLILIQFNPLTIMLGLGSMFLAFSYPFMKRITYWPQLFLGLTFNWGVVMAWTAVNNNISNEIVTLYLSAIFWTLGYDTIYGVQDMVDDEIIGVKSTSIKFKKNIKFFVGISYLLTSLILIYLFQDMINLNLFTILLIFFILSLIYQVKKFNKHKAKDCLVAFKFNNISGLILFLGICSINL
ncbi:MAG: 4-hydroxybenzoate polyprenyltransferase [Candidatus Pelagibacter sp. TMED153]|nr:MAG: 4-hydroxybenzoate polyprenyltransferase [Candidatus Pelagibacter sp. TMED153]|tara:strand:+ start:2473 stop:3333 length:861 start_codon:yes stop_codon:yes gene_type:complete